MTLNFTGMQYCKTCTEESTAVPYGANFVYFVLSSRDIDRFSNLLHTIGKFEMKWSLKIPPRLKVSLQYPLPC